MVLLSEDYRFLLWHKLLSVQGFDYLPIACALVILVNYTSLLEAHKGSKANIVITENFNQMIWTDDIILDMLKKAISKIG